MIGTNWAKKELWLIILNRWIVWVKTNSCCVQHYEHKQNKMYDNWAITVEPTPAGDEYELYIYMYENRKSPF